MGASYTSQWFDACRTDNVELVHYGIHYFARRRDPKGGDGVRYKGFTGLLYACFYNSMNVIRVLLPYEFDLTTNGTNDLPATVYTPNCVSQYPICPGMSCIYLSIIRGYIEIADYILREVTRLPRYYQSLYGHYDCCGRTALDVLIQYNYTAGFTLFKMFKDYFLNIEFMKSRTKGPSPVAFSIYFNNQPFFILFLSLTYHKIYGQLVQKYFNEFQFNVSLDGQFPEKMLATQQQLNSCYALIRLMQAGDVPTIPSWIDGHNDCGLSDPKCFRDKNSYTSGTRMRGIQIKLPEHPSAPGSPEPTVTPFRRMRYDLFTEVVASPRGRGIKGHSKSVTVINSTDECSDTDEYKPTQPAKPIVVAPMKKLLASPSLNISID